jgi:hypothetical protein
MAIKHATTTIPPVDRLHLAVDIPDSTSRPNATKGRFRKVMYSLCGEALAAAGITPDRRDPFLDRGDGFAVLIYPSDEVPRTALLDTVVPTLVDSLLKYNDEHPAEHLRLRTAINAGPVHNDGDGWYGESLDLTFRLLNSSQLKKRVRETAEPLALVVSEEIYSTVVRQGYDGIDAHMFHSDVRVQIAGHRYRGWTWIPGDDRKARES